MSNSRQVYNSKKYKIDKWLKLFPPSKVKKEDWSWIQINSPNFSFPKEDQEGAMKEWNKTKNKMENNKIDTELINNIARKYNILSGKWLIWVDEKSVDNSWEIIAKSIENKMLSACGAKVPPSGGFGGHMICVYTHDFSDEKDIMKVRRELKDLGFSQPLSYKADIYTDIGVNHCMYKK